MIEIVVLTYNSDTPAQRLSARFGEAGGTVGRSEDNLFVLPDPKHHVSRRQAAISSDGRQHWITNLSHANPTLLNGTELPCEVAQPLRPGDEICIGLYRLQARAVTAEPASMPLAHRAMPASAASVTPASVCASAPASAASMTASKTMSSSVRMAAAQAAPATQPAPATALAAEAADPQALLQAFLDGAGIPSITLSSGLTPELMTMIGSLLATAIDGTVDLLGLRSLVKREVNAEVTMVVVRNNNPLKFLPDGATVLTQMLRKRMPGFMGPIEAMQDAYDDLHAHQLGMMAGMQAALGELHGRLDPAAIAAHAEPTSAFERLLPASRKARNWDRYCTLHRETGESLGDSTQSMARSAFLAAYERASEGYLDEAANAR